MVRLRHIDSGISHLYPEFSAYRYLLEQSPSSASRDRANQRLNSLGEYASVVLAFAGSVRDGVDGGKSFRADTDDRLLRGAACIVDCVLRATTLHPGLRRTGFQIA